MAISSRGESLRVLLDKARDTFKDKIDPDNKPEVFAFAPGRVNLIGEHTDYNDGLVFPMAIDQITVIVGRLRPNPNDGNCRLISLANDLGQSDLSVPVPHPPPLDKYNDPSARMNESDKTWYRYLVGVVALMNMNHDGSSVGIPPFEAVIVTDVPIGGGLSSSAALEVATYYFIEQICSKALIRLPQRSLQERALLCQRAEHLYANAPCGIMDQFVCVLANESTACYIDCRKSADGSYVSENVPLRIGEEGLVIMIINCKVKHEVSDGGYERRRDMCYAAAKIMNKPTLREVTQEDIEGHRLELSSLSVDNGPTLYQCVTHVVQEIRRTIQARQVLANGQYREFGRLMNESHASLRDHYKVSCRELDELVYLVREDSDGVYGSRMTGAGWGGCTVTLLKQSAVNDAMKRIKDGYFAPRNLVPEYYIVNPCNGGGTID